MFDLFIKRPIQSTNRRKYIKSNTKFALDEFYGNGWITSMKCKFVSTLQKYNFNKFSQSYMRYQTIK